MLLLLLVYEENKNGKQYKNRIKRTREHTRPYYKWPYRGVQLAAVIYDHGN